jgi:hypothetical protein
MQTITAITNPNSNTVVSAVIATVGITFTNCIACT